MKIINKKIRRLKKWLSKVIILYKNYWKRTTRTEKLSKIWEAIKYCLKEKLYSLDEPYDTVYFPGVTMGDWVEAVYCEMERRKCFNSS